MIAVPNQVPFTVRACFQKSSRGIHLGVAVVVAVALQLFAPHGFAESEALIVVGLAGDETDAEHFKTLAERTAKLLTARGIAAERVAVLSSRPDGKVTRERIMAALRATAARIKAEDEFWLVLYGHAGRSSSGSPAFQVSGPRLTAEDLQETLQAITARRNVFIATEKSGTFLPFLADANCTALAATAEAGEVSQPRFPEHWVEALAENPKASLAALAARAAQR
ncbi:MAG: hypothetical protein M3463_19675, partial [Verrucomicrobiota bacterium]|nr:hypothetical protein [Verrucomicrobiota bacterium]